MTCRSIASARRRFASTVDTNARARIYTRTFQGARFHFQRKPAINLKVPIVILDELSEDIIRSTGSLDLASGEIFDVRYDVERGGQLGMPAADEQYEFTCGTLTSDGKDVEFRIDVDVMRGTYFVNPTELLELKVRAAKLFAGLDGKALAMSNAGRAGSAAPGAQDPASGDPSRRLH